MQTLLKPIALATAGLLATQLGLNAQSFNSASSKAQSDLEGALSELNEVRENIAKEKIPLIREVLPSEVRKMNGVNREWETLCEFSPA